MKMITLRCPNCGASLEIDNGIDTFFCMHCGHKIIMAHMDKEAIKARVKIKSMEHEERLVDKYHQQERYKIRNQNRNDWLIGGISIGLLLLGMFICGIVTVIGNNGAAKQERKLQSIVDEIMIDIDNGDFTAAYIKANSLYWDSDWTSEGKDKWNATRKAIIKQIQEAEKAATGTITYEDTEENWFTNLFN